MIFLFISLCLFPDDPNQRVCNEVALPKVYQSTDACSQASDTAIPAWLAGARVPYRLLFYRCGPLEGGVEI